MEKVNPLVILFAVLDSNTWSASQLTSWANRLIQSTENPKAWLTDLSVSGSVDEGLQIVREAMKEFGVLLPDDIGDLMAGLILLQFDNAELAEKTARSQLIDIVDAYGASCVDAEAAGKLGLKDPVYSELRENAEQTVRYLNSKQLLEVGRKFIGN